jgi:catechol 2,3-dioxygenase-like lactoylglutathione lyase family enzyme
MIEGLSHITFVVRDLDRMSKLLVTVFDAVEVYSGENSGFSATKTKFFLINRIWIAILEGEPWIAKTYNHVAFKIDRRDLEMYVQRIQSLGLDILENRSRMEEEGKSLYFYDYDNHLFELHTGTLDQRLDGYKKAIT